MKVGDMVQWIDQPVWEHAGLGIVTDVWKESKHAACEGTTFQVAWLHDIKDLGWDVAIKDFAKWYDIEDVDESIVLIAGVE